MLNSLQVFEISKQKDMVYRLHKALYRLKQAPKAWHDQIDTFFLSLGFQNCYADNNLYIFSQDNLLCLIILYVDDLLITGSLASKIEELHADLKTTFEMTDLGLLHYFIGMEVYQSHGGIFLSQHRYLKQLLETYSMSNCRPFPVQWIQTQSYLVKIILPSLKILRNIEG